MARAEVSLSQRPLANSLVNLQPNSWRKVYCTVVSAEEADYLEQYGVTRGRVVDVTTTSLAQSLDRDCFDIVLSLEGGTSPGEAWNHTAPFGKFVDLSRNTSEASKDKQAIMHSNNRTHVSVDIKQLVLHRPDVCHGQVMFKPNCIVHYPLTQIQAPHQGS